MALTEKIHISQKPTFLAYNIPDFGAIGNLLLKNYQGNMQFESVSANKTRLTWIGHFENGMFGGLSEPLVRALMKSMISTFAKRMKIYLEK